MAKKKKETKKVENHNHEEHDVNTCPDCGKKSKPIIDMFEGEHFNVWGNDDFISINLYYNDAVLTFPSEIWDSMRSDLQVIGMIPIPYSKDNGSPSPEQLN